MTDRGTYELTVPALLENIPVILKFTKGILNELGFNKHDSFDVQTAMDEACINIVNHGYDESGEICIKLHNRVADIVISIESHGKPFDPETAAKPDLTSSVSERKIGGLGVYLIHQLMDEVSYNSIDNVNTLTMIKNKMSDIKNYKRGNI
ncbi:ATP-binding protein [Candidatus Magnetomonas plexicatena]|uniref:ATP-binding protein n=1 Tax=Candidatus Magnetomonas plexicatena TaxID=2552947 RepID=UPI001C773105|nr:ATP-binding protein [Nitrospirales bacterium LBB_01]